MNEEGPSVTVLPSHAPTSTKHEILAETGDDHVAEAMPHAAGITSELLAVIELAASVFVGKQVSILSIQPVHSHNVDTSVWLSQGRDMQQASHNLVQRQH